MVFGYTPLGISAAKVLQHLKGVFKQLLLLKKQNVLVKPASTAACTFLGTHYMIL